MSDPKEMRKRLDALNRRPLPEHRESDVDVEGIRRKLQKQGGGGAAPEAIVYRRGVPRSDARPERPRIRADRHVVLEEATDGVEVRTTHGGKAYVIDQRITDLAETWEPLCEAFAREMSDGSSSTQRRLSALCEAGRVRPEDVLFMDLESTGLAGTPLFLIGAMAWEGDGLVVRQYLARDYSEERAVISLFLDRAATGKLLVSFNGKSFDVPYIRVRAAANRVPFGLDTAHLDLLHEARRAWRHMLPDCKLQTLESRICGRPRYADIPGSEIPEAYHAYVRTGNAVEIIDILEHNMLDLVTLAELMVKLPG